MSGAEVILGVVAGGAGLASLAIQLQENVDKLRTFCQSVKHADERLKRLIFELESTTLQLKEIETDVKLAISGDELLDRCIAQCQRYATDLQETAAQIESHMRRSKKTGRIFWALKEHDVDKLWTKIERANVQLQLAMHRLAFRQICGLRNDMPKLLAIASASTPRKEAQTDDQDRHTRDKDKSVASRRSRGKPRWQMRFTAWFSATVFDVAVHHAQGSWTVLLRTETHRPFNAKVYRACKHGDIDGLQQMIDTRRVSFTDIFEGPSEDDGRGTLLSVAASYGQLALCKWLFSQTTWPNDLHHRSMWIWPYPQPADALRLFTEHTEAGVDIELGSDELQNWNFISDDECIKVLLRNKSVPVHTPSLQDRLRMASGFLNLMSPASWLGGFGLLDSDTQLAKTTSESGWTALHEVAWEIGHGRSKSAWTKFGVRLLKAGADMNALAAYHTKSLRRPSSPLLCLLSLADDMENLLGDLVIWLSMLREAGIDLNYYHLKEVGLWAKLDLSHKDYHLKSLYWRRPGPLRPLSPLRTSLTGLISHADPTRWSVDCRDHAKIEIFELRPPVGSFPQEHRTPTTIAWTPRSHEVEEGPWELKSTLWLHGARYNAEKRNLEDQDKMRFLHREVMVNSAQDDASFALLSERRTLSRHSSRKRSASAFKPSEPQHDRLWGWDRFCWIPDRLRDGRWNETSQSTSIFEEEAWYTNSFLANIKDCQEDVTDLRVGRFYMTEPTHTGQPGCPWGCDKVQLDKLSVPESCRDQHPTVRKGYEP